MDYDNYEWDTLYSVALQLKEIWMLEIKLECNIIIKLSVMQKEVYNKWLLTKGSL